MTLLEQPPGRGTRAAALERIEAFVENLAPAQRNVAERLLADPAQAIALSISEFADLCGVAQPTVSRFCRSVGFANYASLRLGVAADFAADGRSGPAPGPDGKPANTAYLDAIGPETASAVRTASRLEIWSSPEMMGAAEFLSGRLAAIDVQASSTVSPSYWPDRARALPADSMVLLLGVDSEDMWAAGVAAAREASARVIYASNRPVASLVKQAHSFIPLPPATSDALSAQMMAETLAIMVRSISNYAGPPGPASPWRPWPHSDKLYLPTSGDPIPAILLSQPQPLKRRSLVIFYAGIGSTKEIVAPPRQPTDVATPSMVAALLNAGHNVLLPDAPGHGERKHGWEDTNDLFLQGIQEQGPDYLGQIRAETPELINAALRLGVVSSPTQIAVGGQSFGGMQAILKLAADQRIACGVAIMPICDISDMEQFTAMRGMPRLVSGGPSAALARELAPRPLLLVGGGKDVTAPAAHIQQFVDSIAGPYLRAGAVENLTYLMINDLAHKFDTRQVDAMLDWLDRHLAGKKTSRRHSPKAH